MRLLTLLIGACLILAAYLLRYSPPACLLNPYYATVSCYATDRWTGQVVLKTTVPESPRADSIFVSHVRHH